MPPPSRRTFALRRLLPRRRRTCSTHSVQSLRLSRVIYNFLPGARAGTLSTVIYSDRYFLYGLPLRTHPSPSSDSSAHYTPLPTVGAPQAPGGGVLLGLEWPRSRPPARYGSVRRGRKDLPRVFEAPLEATGLYPARRLPLDYRQPAEGSSLGHASLPVTGRRMRCESPSPRLYSEIESAPRPEFARPEGTESPSRPSSVVASEHTLPASLQYGMSGPSATYEAVGSQGSLGASGGVLYRKVLNTERSPPPLVSYGASRDPRVRAQRRVINALLILSGAFYTVSFLAFYFLSLP